MAQGRTADMVATISMVTITKSATVDEFTGFPGMNFTDDPTRTSLAAPAEKQERV